MNTEKKVTKYNEYVSQVDPKIIEKWAEEQNKLKKLLVQDEKLSFSVNPKDKSKPFLKRVGGVDISTMKQDRSRGIAALVIMDYTSKKVNKYNKGFI